jgi:hypothetical protein
MESKATVSRMKARSARRGLQAVLEEAHEYELELASDFYLQ